jgi:methyltransferase (TIGR00027 family)
MRPGIPSKTAEHNALFRALETRRPQAERLLDDPLAEAFLSWPFRTLVALARARPLRGSLIRLIDHQWPGVRTSVIARTRLIDDAIDDVVIRTPQVVILGAGFDTRAWRLDRLRDVDVFEVDHPDTQRKKRATLEQLGVDRTSVRFVSTDFHLGYLESAMSKAGFDPSAPTCFLWEGTTNYLTAEAVDATMRWFAHAGASSHVIFTYINNDVLIDPSRYFGAERVFSTLRRTDEQMTFGLAPDELADYLANRGLRLISDIGAAAYRAQFYGTEAQKMRGHEFYRVAQAATEPVRAAR